MTDTPVFLDVSLAFLIRKTQMITSPPKRRLNGIENLISYLVQRWRPVAPLNPRLELRMTPETLNAMLSWVGCPSPDDVEAHRRLEAYRAERVIDMDLPDGWIRVLLPCVRETQA
jgi:hypothetical protein